MTFVNIKNIFTSGPDQDALTTTTPGEHILNFGNLTTTGDVANGIFAGANNRSVSNFGRIDTSGLGAAGIYAEGSHAHIDNYGSIVTHGGSFDPDPNVDGDEFFSEGIFANGDGFHIANYGSVRVEGKFSSGLIGLGADGVIVNYGRVDSASDGLALAALGDRSQVINAGLVTATGHDTDVLHVSGEGAVAINLGGILVNGPDIAGMAGVHVDTHVTNKGSIIVTGDGGSFAMGGFGDGHHVANLGLIVTHGAFATGMEAIDGLNLQLLNAGHIATNGDLAVGVALGLASFGPGFVDATDGTVDNRGVIETNGDGAAGVIIAGDGDHLTNSGRITTDGAEFNGDPIGPMRAAGVVVSGNDALIENSGTIESRNAASAAVELNVVERDGVTFADTTSTLDNHGLIKGAGAAVLGGAGQETVINHGHIIGDVNLGDGADKFVFGKAGSLAGDLYLGGGDDLVRFEKGAGTEHIADFEAGIIGGDVVDVSAFFSGFNALRTHSSQHGNDVIIDFGHGDQLVFDHLKLSALTAADFLFA